MAELRIEVSDSTTPTVVLLNGEVDLSTAGRLRDDLEAVAASGVTDVVIDLREASFLDGTGLGILLGGVERLRRLGSVTLRSPSVDVRRMIELAPLQPGVRIESPAGG